MSEASPELRALHRDAVKAAHDAVDDRIHASTMSAVELYQRAAEAAPRLPETVPQALREALAAALTAEAALIDITGGIGTRSLIGSSKSRAWLAFAVLDAAGEGSP